MTGETNINGGAGLNGKGALLKINAETGSTITVSKEGYSKVIKTSQLDPDDNNRSYWFFQTKDFGEWTVTATKGEKIKSDTVIVTSEGQSVSVQLSYAVDIFNGGAIVPFSTQNASSAVVEIGTEIVFSQVSNNPYNRGALAYTTNKVDLTGYNTIVFEGTFTSVVNSNTDKSRVGIMETAAQGQTYWVTSTELDTINNSWEVDISSISGSYHICAFAGQGYSDALIGSITRIYLL